MAAARYAAALRPIAAVLQLTAACHICCAFVRVLPLLLRYAHYLVWIHRLRSPHMEGQTRVCGANASVWESPRCGTTRGLNNKRKHLKKVIVQRK